MSPLPGMSYAAAGVDIEAGAKAVELITPAVASTHRAGVLGGIGGFAGLFALDLEKYPRPILASSTDGVGTKLAIARAMDVHDTVGIDLVAMVVDDLVVCGAEPLFLQDYIACATVVPERIESIVAGIAAGCRQAGCALVGGEIAEHGELMAVGDYDLSATGVGAVNADAVVDGSAVHAGDLVLALGSSGLHSNGYSLARKVLLQHAGLRLDAEVAELGRTLGAELLEPTRIYALHCLALIGDVGVHGLAHVTGGGLAGNLARVLPPGVQAVVERSTWTPQPIFGLIAELGGVEQAELDRTFNLGVGMVAILAAEDAERAVALLAARGVPAWVAGHIAAADDGPGSARLVGSHPR